MMQSRSVLPTAFWRHFAASAASNLGDGMIAAAGPLLALSLTDDVRLIAFTSVASTLPWLVLSLPAGVFIDRHDRKRILTTVNAARCALFAALVALIVTGTLTIWILLAVLLAVAVCEVFFDMSAQAFLPAIVPDESLERANGRLYAVEVTANSFLGLPFGSWLFVVAAAAPFAVHAAALGLSALLIASIRTHSTPVLTARSENFVASLREGLVWLWRHHLLRLLALMLGAANMCHMFGQAIFAKFVRDELGLGPRGFGILLATMSVGSIIGGTLGGRVAKRLGPTTSIVLAYAFFAGLEIIPAAYPRVWSVVIAGFLMSVVGTLWNVITVSLRQRLIPAELFGRVNSVYRFLGTGTMTIGAFLGGLIAFRFGLRATYWASAGILAIVLLVGAPRLLRLAREHAASAA
jgi:MFS family permease